MSKIQIKEYNCETGEEIIRDATAEEIENIKVIAENYKTRKEELLAKEAARQAILDRMGITAEEARLLLS
jgi:hypothetical protein